MCCVKEKSESRVRNCAGKEERGKSTWMLKSPVMTISALEVARSARRLENSDRKDVDELVGGR